MREEACGPEQRGVSDRGGLSPQATSGQRLCAGLLFLLCAVWPCLLRYSCVLVRLLPKQSVLGPLSTP